MRDINIMGWRNHMLQLLPSKQIQSDKISLEQNNTIFRNLILLVSTKLII